jgi:tRNA(fMet)-specific endonuclease VapC
MFLLNTDTIITILKGHVRVLENLRRNFDEPMCLSVISLMELYYGAYKSQQVTSNLAKIRTLESKLEIMPVGRESSEIFGMLKANLEKQGTPLDDFDLTLASCALAHNLVLVTNNVKHFQRIDGLRLVNWAK